MMKYILLSTLLLISTITLSLLLSSSSSSVSAQDEDTRPILPDNLQYFDVPLAAGDIIPKSIIDVVLSMARIGSDSIVYELGSGDGSLAIAAAKAGAKKVVGLEYSEEVVAGAYEHAKDEGVATNLTDDVNARLSFAAIPNVMSVKHRFPDIHEANVVILSRVPDGIIREHAEKEKEIAELKQARRDLAKQRMELKAKGEPYEHLGGGDFVDEEHLAEKTEQDIANDEMARYARHVTAIGDIFFRDLKPGTLVLSINNHFQRHPSRSTFLGHVNGKLYRVFNHATAHHHQTALEHEIGNKVLFYVPAPINFVSESSQEETDTSEFQMHRFLSTTAKHSGVHTGQYSKTEKQQKRKEAATAGEIVEEPQIQDAVGIVGENDEVPGKKEFEAPTTEEEEEEKVDKDHEGKYFNHAFVTLTVNRGVVTAIRFEPDDTIATLPDFSMRIRDVKKNEFLTGWTPSRGEPQMVADPETGESKMESPKYDTFTLSQPVSVPAVIEVEVMLATEAAKVPASSHDYSSGEQQ